MAYSQFEPYREQVQAWKSQRVPKAEMLRRLHEENPEEGFLDKKSSFYPFVDSLGASSPNGLEQILQPLQEDIRQMHGSMQKILQAVRENDEEAVQRHQAVMQAVNQKSTPLVPELMGRHMSQTPFAPSQGAYSLPRKRVFPRFGIPGLRRIPRPVLGLLLVAVAILINTVDISKHFNDLLKTYMPQEQKQGYKVKESGRF